jgi:hypothetical protein
MNNDSLSREMEHLCVLSRYEKYLYFLKGMRENSNDSHPKWPIYEQEIEHVTSWVRSSIAV